jgi:lycopene cyclase domain-containing protein
MSLYLAILLFSAAFPFLLSFDRKVRFYSLWRSLFPSVLIAGAIYIFADIVFVRKGIWGFDPRYHSGIVLNGLPLEEWLFFILIPYSCVFIHYVFIAYFPNVAAGARTTRAFSLLLISLLMLLIVFNIHKAYTVFNFSLMIIVLVLALLFSIDMLRRYMITFLIMLVPFFMTNLVLTGSFIPGEVVWYNNEENLSVRIFTVPVEDIGYAFALVLLNLFFIDRFEYYYRRYITGR